MWWSKKSRPACDISGTAPATSVQPDTTPSSAPGEQPGQQIWAQIPAFPTWKKTQTLGCEGKTCCPRGLSLSGCTARVGGDESGGLFVREMALKRSCVALGQMPSGAAKGWASDCFLISEMSLSHE